MVVFPVINAALVGFIMARVPTQLQGRVGAVSSLRNIFAGCALVICGWILSVSIAGVCEYLSHRHCVFASHCPSVKLGM